MNSQKITARKSNFELLRIVAILSIIIYHAALHEGFTLSENYFVNNVFLQAMFFGGKFGVHIFILISGFFLIDQDFRMSKFVKIISQYTFYSIILFALAVTFNITSFQYGKLIKAIFPLTGFSWFADAYVLLYMFFPFLNVMLKNLRQNEHKLLLCMGGVIWFLIPSVSILFGLDIYFKMNWGNLILFAYLYSVGAYFKLYQKDTHFQYPGWIAILSFFSYLILSVILYNYCKKVPFINHNPFFWSEETSIFILIASVSTFIFFKSLSLNNNSVINTVSSTTFGIYLLHDCSLTRGFLWSKLFHVKSYYTEPTFILSVLGIVLTIFLTCAIIDLFRINLLEKPLLGKFTREIDDEFEKIKDAYLNC